VTPLVPLLAHVRIRPVDGDAYDRDGRDEGHGRDHHQGTDQFSLVAAQIDGVEVRP